MKTISVLFPALLLSVLLIECTNGGNEKDENREGDSSVREKPKEGEMSEADLIARGNYLVQVMDCGTCHTPKVMTKEGPMPDEGKLLSGHPSGEKLPAFDRAIIQKGLVVMNGSITAFSGPWGVSYAANLTPDDTGIKNWSYENFEKAMRQGKFKGLDGSRMILPPMPWQAFKNLTDDDLKAIYSYLKSIRPVTNLVPPAEPPAS